MNGHDSDGVVADTSVVSFSLSDRPKDSLIADRYRQHLEDRPVAISFQTDAELLLGAETQGWDLQRYSSLVADFEIVGWSIRLLGCYVRIRSAAIDRRRRTGEKRIDAADGWVAASALLLERPLVTHDGALSRSPLIETITELDA